MHKDNITSITRRKIACPLTSEDDVFAAATHLEICLLSNSPELTTALTRLLEIVRLRRRIVNDNDRSFERWREKDRIS